MDIINSALAYLQDFINKSETIYHVNPLIFGILFFGSAVPLYYGYYRIGRSFIKLENNKFIKKQLDKKELIIGLVISIVSWCLPYLYVILFGKLPINIWIFFAVFIIITGVFFVRTIRKKIVDAKI